MNSAHTGTGVSSTQGRTRYCRCNTCGHTWKKSGKYADPLREVAASLIETLRATKRLEQKGAKIIVLSDSMVEDIVSQLEQAL